jgi:hypothetical protein
MQRHVIASGSPRKPRTLIAGLPLRADICRDQPM